MTAADTAVRRLSFGTADLRSGLFLALLAAGTYELLRGNVTAPAATLFWYAGDMLRLRERIETALSGKTAGEDRTIPAAGSAVCGLELVHAAVPGRVRYPLPRMHRDNALKRALETGLAATVSAW